MMTTATATTVTTATTIGRTRATGDMDVPTPLEFCGDILVLLFIFPVLQLPTVAYPPITALGPSVPSPYLSFRLSAVANLVPRSPRPIARKYVHMARSLSTSLHLLTYLSTGDLRAGGQLARQAKETSRNHLIMKIQFKYTVVARRCPSLPVIASPCQSLVASKHYVNDSTNGLILAILMSHLAHWLSVAEPLKPPSMIHLSTDPPVLSHI